MSQDRRQRNACPDSGDGLVHTPFSHQPDRLRDIEMYRAGALAGRDAVTEMVAQEQLEGSATRGLDPLGLALYDHPVFRLGGARGHQMVGAIDADDTDHTRGLRATALPEAQCRDLDAEQARSLQDRRPGCDLDFLTIYGECWHVTLSMRKLSGSRRGDYSMTTASTGQTCRQVSQRIHFSGSISCCWCGLIAMASPGHRWAHRVQPMHSSVIR